MSSSKTGVLLLNLGSPSGYDVASVRKYHREFFSDPFVFDISNFGRQLLTNLVILPFRSPKVAGYYKKIWTENGSPLIAHMHSLAVVLQNKLGESYKVAIAMNYGVPSMGEALVELNDPALDRLVAVPLFPQFAASTSGSVMHSLEKHLKSWPGHPPFDWVKSFCNHPAFIRAWAARSRDYNLADYDHLIFSFHGLPIRHIRQQERCGWRCLEPGCCDSIRAENSGCYRARCYETARLLASALQIEKPEYSVAFQSRLGRASWIRPYMADVVKNCAVNGKSKLLVFPLSFVADCLETIHEIGSEYKERFVQMGGEQLDVVESLNDAEFWCDGLCSIITGS